jgi:hypothetical protein
MDEARRFRFLIPPFFLAVSLIAGLYFSEFSLEQVLKSYSTEHLLAFGAVIGASVLPLGFLLTSLSILGLYACARAFGFKTYEAVLPTETWKRLWPLLSTSLPQDTKWHLYAAATFDHALLAPGVHEWIQRRWTTFNLSVHSFAAVAMSHFAALLPAVRETWEWVLLTATLLLVFGVTARIAWLHTMRMLEFQASRDAGVFQGQANPPLQPTSGAGTLV